MLRYTCAVLCCVVPVQLDLHSKSCLQRVCASAGSRECARVLRLRGDFSPAYSCICKFEGGSVNAVLLAMQPYAKIHQNGTGVVSRSAFSIYEHAPLSHQAKMSFSGSYRAIK